MVLVFKEKNSAFNDVHAVTVSDAGSLYGNQFMYFEKRQGFVSDEDNVCDGKSIDSIQRSAYMWLANGLVTKDEEDRYVYEVEILYMSPELHATFN